MTDEDQKHLLPSRRQTTLANRIAWAKSYLKQAGLVQSPSRGAIQITAAGAAVLREKPDRVDIHYLMRFPQFEAFRKRASDGETAGPEAKETPEELLDSHYQDVRKALAADLLQRVRQTEPQFFEKLVIDLLVAMGYGGTRPDAAKLRGGPGDDGIDGVINEDRLGLDVVYIQAKRWNNPVGRPTVQSFAGSIEGHKARKGVLITTSDFSRDAMEYIQRIEKRIVLINGEQLVELMIDHDIGVTTAATYRVKRVDSDYFSEPE